MQIVTDRSQAPTAIRTDLGANSSRWNSIGRLADYVAVAGRRRKDVEAYGSQRRCRRTLVAVSLSSRTRRWSARGRSFQSRNQETGLYGLLGSVHRLLRR